MKLCIFKIEKDELIFYICFYINTFLFIDFLFGIYYEDLIYDILKSMLCGIGLGQVSCGMD
jgi:hypothetical protein